ncbi:CbbQ/NirQ/NorQ/GpvN family protein [Hydrogenophaga laconesensis]|uniref:Nitric oxide reductase NorQ protein n=1 Tax=Hydrogenophaga laconesensis TaxID=1805971 RepID=A0ABU1VFU5_9BURK|nr:CbbQ/NirQ/NorQ/GpvN family protein [Hydrogenophaga laconesensis]MDR7096337.1 nitric oxide reductase NorQ protein [Hydrogenophaga laconesensis]
MDPLAGWRLDQEPYYQPAGREIEAFEAARASRLPVLLKGPTGCGKTRFVEHMAWRLKVPLVTVACHEDLTAGDLAGRWLLDAQGTRWMDGPLAMAARHGALCYLDELLEARSDTTVLLHPLADTRRALPLERHGELLQAHPDFQLVVSYNPGYQGVHKRLKPSTRQRFVALEFRYPEPTVEAAIVVREGGIDESLARRLVQLAERTRRLQDQGLEEGASTRMLVHAARLVRAGLPPALAARQAIADPLSDDAELLAALNALVCASF